MADKWAESWDEQTVALLAADWADELVVAIVVLKATLKAGAMVYRKDGL